MNIVMKKPESNVIYVVDFNISEVMTYGEMLKSLKKLANKGYGKHKVCSATSTLNGVENIRKIEVSTKKNNVFISPDYEYVKEYSFAELEKFVSESKNSDELKKLGVSSLCTMLNYNKTRVAKEMEFTVDKLITELEKKNIDMDKVAMVGNSKVATPINGVAVYENVVILANEYFKNDSKHTVEWKMLA